jgi:tRNA(Arg) A34 adenosine deaminase TadA
MNNPYNFIDTAIEEAKKSLREGNSGFGAIIIKNNELVSKAHDTDTISKDPTSHAEINAIRLASTKLEGDFKDCMLISTHEPCPMCSTAIVWAGIKQIAYGFSIKDALNQGRNRINLTCDEVFKRAGADIEITHEVKKNECAILYNRQIRESVKQLRNADSDKFKELSESLKNKRLCWFASHQFQYDEKEPLDAAYNLFLTKLGISSEQAPIVEKQKNKLVIHSKNFCPTLEACKILGLDTRDVCEKLSEEATQTLLQQLNPNIRFERNYDRLRPNKSYCEEMILLVNDD